MDKTTIIEGDLNARDARFTIVASRFNDFIVESLIKGAVSCLRRHGAGDSSIEIIRVPGAYEMPLAVDKVAAARRADGIIALGAVIRGATPHFEYVAGECTRGIAASSRQHGVPIGVGVLTTDTIEQAIERAGTKAGNKGEEAALAVIEMVNLLRARELIVQSLYQRQITGHSESELLSQFHNRPDYERVDQEYFDEVLSAICRITEQLEESIDKVADRPLSQLDPVERGILLLGFYELQEKPEVPFKVVINESVNIAKRFGAIDGHKYINAVLDRAVKKLRPDS
jgi:6,7-dimethyl-8-ribityllumazine synthase